MSTPNTISRRKFLKVAGVTLAASTLACCGAGALATLPPQVNLTETHAEGAKMTTKILVAYASKAGSTAEVAEAIGQTISAKGAAVDVLQIKHVKDLNAYQAIILGSAIRMGQWLPEAAKFVETNQETLRQMPLAYFLVCATLKDDTPDNRRTVAAYLDPVRKIVEPQAVGTFGGKMDYGKLSFVERILISQFIKTPEGDFRNWDEIRTWAGQALPAA
jgi:menaquinone-dependent protoporphyrinogen oxidase